MNNNTVKKSTYIKGFVLAALATMPAFASADVIESMKEAATKLEALSGGVEAIGGAALGLAILIKGYSVGKGVIRRA